jgi:hypothetical protein
MGGWPVCPDDVVWTVAGHPVESFGTAAMDDVPVLMIG